MSCPCRYVLERPSHIVVVTVWRPSCPLFSGSKRPVSVPFPFRSVSGAVQRWWAVPAGSGAPCRWRGGGAGIGGQSILQLEPPLSPPCSATVRPRRRYTHGLRAQWRAVWRPAGTREPSCDAQRPAEGLGVANYTPKVTSVNGMFYDFI